MVKWRWCGILKGFVSCSSNKVDENANAANDSLLARQHLLTRLLRIPRSESLVDTATETKVSAGRRIKDKERLCELGIIGVTQFQVEKSF